MKLDRPAPLVRLEEWVCVALTATIVIAVGLQVLFRYVFHAPLVWTDELARYSVVWLTFISAALVAARQGHVAVELADSFLGKRRVRWVKIFACCLVIGVCFAMVIGSITPVMLSARRLSTALRIPVWVLTVAAPVGFALIGFHGLQTLRRLVRGNADDREAADSETR